MTVGVRALLCGVGWHAWTRQSRSWGVFQHRGAAITLSPTSPLRVHQERNECEHCRKRGPLLDVWIEEATR